MKSSKYSFQIILFTFLLISFSHVGILHVQDDCERFQSTIDEADGSGAVLVDPETGRDEISWREYDGEQNLEHGGYHAQ